MAKVDREEGVALRQKQSERANRKDYSLACLLGLYVQRIARFSVLELTVRLPAPPLSSPPCVSGCGPNSKTTNGIFTQPLS